MIKNFTDLISWQKSHQIVLEIYKITKKFPSSEMFGLTNQLRRASVSISSNIAEGFTRQSAKEKCQFYYTSRGSLSEVLSQLLIARDVGYITPTEFNKFSEAINEVGKLLTGLIKSIRP